jgi:hypothetical protein
MVSFRLTSAAILLAFVASLGSTAYGQGAVAPRDVDKLVARAQQFWNFLKAGKLSSASDFVIAKDRDRFVGTPGAPIKDFQIDGLLLTGDRNKAILRTNLEEFPNANVLKHIANQSWIWKDNNWFLELGEAQRPDAFVQLISDIEYKKWQKEFENSLSLEADSIDVGTLTRGEIGTFPLPINYTAKADLNVESLPPSTFVGARAAGLPAATRSIPIYVDSNNAPDEFSVPVALRFWAGTAFVEKKITVKGKIFTVISFRVQGTIEPGKRISIFVKNNSDKTAKVMYFTSGENYDLVSTPGAIPPHSEAEVVLDIHRDAKPESLGLLLNEPINGFSQFTYKIEPSH